MYFAYATLSWSLYLCDTYILLPNGVLLFENGAQWTNISKRFCQHKNNNHFDANKKIIIIKNKCRKMFFVRLKSKSLVLPARISLTTSIEFFQSLLIFHFSFYIFEKKLHSQITFFSVCSCTTLIFIIFQIVLCRYIHCTRKTFLSFKFWVCIMYMHVYL